MSALRGDARLRSLERAAAAGDVEAQARQLAERVRAGKLTRERLELAAYCGEVAAETALDVQGVTLGQVLERPFPKGTVGRELADEWANALHVQLAARPLAYMDLDMWILGLAGWGTDVPVRALLAVARRRLTSWMLEVHAGGRRCRLIGDREGCSAVRHALWTCEEWLRAPGQRTGDDWSRSYHPALPLWVPVSTMALAGGEQAVAAAVRAAVEKLPQALARVVAEGALADWALGRAPAPHVDPDPELPPTPVAALDGGGDA